MILSCSEWKIYEIVRHGKIHGYGDRRTKGLRILASELREYVQSIKIDRDSWLK